MATRNSEDPALALEGARENNSADAAVWSPTEDLLRNKTPGKEPVHAALILGSRLGHFRVIAELGRGGMGVVYRAEDETLRREVALKVLPVFHSGDVELRRQLLQEARAAAAVNHPNIATVYEISEADGRIYIAMEFIQGKTLRQRVAERKLPVADVVRIGRQILRGLQKAHEAGLVHRDLKPDNVMVTQEGVTKVLDFGLAKQRAQAEAEPSVNVLDAMVTRDEVTLTAPARGTPRYMSPEHVQGLTADHRSDLFSFGVMLYEMLGRRSPFSGATVIDVLASIIRDEPTPLPSVNPEVPEALWRIVARCLEKQPADRYPDCAAVLAALDPLTQDLQSTQRGLASSFPSDPPPSRGAPRAARRLRRKLPILVAGALGLCGLAATFLWVQRRPQRAPAPASPGPRSTAVTDLPLPVSSNREAISAYQAAVQSSRDGNGGLARESLRRAVAADPSLALAHLRLALNLNLYVPTAEGRESYARAVQGRAALSERDLCLLRALEPVLGRDPPAPGLAAERLREATVRYPHDAELFSLLAAVERVHLEASRSAAQRAIEIDPQHAAAWQLLGVRSAELDQFQAALLSFNRCVEISPAAADCRGAQAAQYGALGRCTEMEQEIRHAISSSREGGFSWYAQRADALYAMGQPPATVLEAFTQKWAQMPEQERRAEELLDRARLDFEAGNFVRAEARAREASHLIQADPNAAPHASSAELLVRINVETGRVKAAGQVAGDYLERKDVWIGASGKRDVTMLMLRTLLHAGALTQKEFASRRGEWLEQGPRVSDADPGRLWIAAYASWIEGPDEAAEAVAALAALPEGAISPYNLRRSGVMVGRAYLLAGRANEAMPLLRPGVWPCASPGEGSVVNFYDLGMAREQQGDRKGACAAYGEVIERWGAARPRSVTVDRSRTRAQALGCGQQSLATAR